MAEEGTTQSQELNERPTEGLRPVGDRRHDLVTSGELHRASPSSQRFGGYSRDEVEDLLERAAATIGELSGELNALRAKLDQSRAVESPPEEIVARMLATASRIVETTKEDAQREAAELVAQARAEADSVAQLQQGVLAELEAIRGETDGILAEAHAEAEAVVGAAQAEADGIVAAARIEAEALTSAARTERERLIADSTRDAEAARNALEAETTRLGEAIEEIRGTWTNRLREALARLDSLDPPSAPPLAAAEPPPQPEPAAPDRIVEVEDLATRANDLVAELRDRAGAAPETQARPEVERADDAGSAEHGHA